MREDVIEALNIIEQACGSVSANLATHQQIQAAIMLTKDEFTRLYKVESDLETQQKAVKTAAQATKSS